LAQGMMPHAREIHKRIRACAMVLSMMVDDCLAATTAALEKLAPARPADIQAAPDRVAGFGPALAPAVRELQKFLMDRVYLHPICRENEIQTRKILSGLFAAYLAQPTLLPQRYQERIARDGLHRVVCDYIAGMTDRYCRKQYETITGATL
jgi:dGTPase